jgi:Sulfotransferase family
MMPTNAAIKRLIFVHLGRTGGTTMRQDVFYRCVDPAAVYWTDGKEPGARGGSADELLAMPHKELERLRVIVGHLPIGLRDRLPWPESWHLAVFVRDPVARTVSEYYQVRSSASNPAHDAGMRYPLEEFVRRGWGLSHNGMCRMLSDECYGRTFDSPEAMYRQAVRNAEACSFVGVTECYRESLHRLCRLCGWRLPAVKARHSCTPKGHTLTERESRVILAHNELDLALYEHCKARFESESEEAVPTAIPLLSRPAARRPAA